MRPSVKPRLLESAIRLFAERGYAGVNVQDIVVHAKTNLTSFKRYFNDKEGAFDKTLDAVIAQTQDPAELALLLIENQQEQDVTVLVQSLAERWYASLTTDAARLLMYAYLSNVTKWKRKARAYLSKAIRVLASALKNKLSPGDLLNPQLAAEMVIMVLWQFKITEAQGKNSKEQSEIVGTLIRQAVRGFAANSPLKFS